MRKTTTVLKASALEALTEIPRSLTAIMKDAGVTSARHRPAWQKAMQELVTEGRAYMQRKHVSQPGSKSNPWLFALDHRKDVKQEPETPETPAEKAYDDVKARTAELTRILNADADVAERRWVNARLDVADAWDRHVAEIAAKDGPAIADTKRAVFKATEASRVAEQRAKDAVWKLRRHQRTTGGA